MKKMIAILSGDGIGSEVMNQALLVLQKISKKYNHDFVTIEKPVGGFAIDNFGSALPEDTLKTCESSDAILFGSVGGPKWDNLPVSKRPESGALLPLRKNFNLFANIRTAGVTKDLKSFSPLKDSIIKDGFEFVVVRELTSDIYFGKKTHGEDFGADEMIYKKEEVERIAKVAFEIAKKRKKKVTSVDKANVLATSIFWRKTVEEIHSKFYQDVELEHLYIDNATMQILSRPKDFDVILTGNLFGDILSDEAAQISGSIGMLASSSMNDKGFGMYEPMGGSAPDIAGKNIANPIAQIKCIALMLRNSFGLEKEATNIENAIVKTLSQGFRTRDIFVEGDKLVGTKEMGEKIIYNL